MTQFSLQSHLKEATTVTRQGKAVAVLVSAEDWENYHCLKKEDKGRESIAADQIMESEQDGNDEKDAME